MESLDALKSAQEVEIQVNSEVSGVQLLLTKSQQVWLLSNDKDRVLGKFTQLGGFGSGSYTKAVECGEGVAYKLPLKDRTPVQIDETSLRGNAPTGSVSTMTLYKLMVLTEKEKGVTSHKISYLNVSRSEEVEAGCDSFNVDMKEDMKFKLLPVEVTKPEVPEVAGEEEMKEEEPAKKCAEKSKKEGVFGEWQPTMGRIFVCNGIRDGSHKDSGVENLELYECIVTEGASGKPMPSYGDWDEKPVTSKQLNDWIAGYRQETCRYVTKGEPKDPSPSDGRDKVKVYRAGGVEPERGELALCAVWCLPRRPRGRGVGCWEEKMRDGLDAIRQAQQDWEVAGLADGCGVTLTEKSLES
ncbi:unnamed protein product [Durusdinium trenchii]|uniref:Uncharacterized protein n=1 Tax=Durusdinium trenchii TaxID=1381693 RepID=A0ABP0L8Y0_9DINO